MSERTEGWYGWGLEGDERVMIDTCWFRIQKAMCKASSILLLFYTLVSSIVVKEMGGGPGEVSVRILVLDDRLSCRDLSRRTRFCWVG